MTTPLREKIVAAGLVENNFMVDLNCAIEDPAPRYPKSRMFRWPISIGRHEDRLTVTCELMTLVPFVRHVCALLATPIEIDDDVPGGLNSRWHHAVDLADDVHYRDLIKTAEYTTPVAIMRGIVINAMYGRLAPAHARELIGATLTVDEPADRSEAALGFAGGILHPAFIDTGQSNGKARSGVGRWAVNLHSRRDHVAELWAAIHGIEDGWFKRDKHGHHWMSDAGMARHMGVPIP